MDRLARLVGLALLCFFLLMLGASAWAIKPIVADAQKVFTVDCPAVAASPPSFSGHPAIILKGGSHREVTDACADRVITRPYSGPGGHSVAWRFDFQNPATLPPTPTGSVSVRYWKDEKLYNSAGLYYYLNTSTGPTITASWATETACPANASWIPGSQSMCNCNLGYMPKFVNGDEQCVQYTCPPSGSYSAVTTPDLAVPSVGVSHCTGGCEFTASSHSVGANGQIWARWPLKSTGAFCEGAQAADQSTTGEQHMDNPAPIACAATLCPGTLNGTDVCVPCSKTVEKGPSSSASAPGDGTGPPSSTTTETETSCTQSSCTTTTTTKDGNGNVISEKKEEKGQESFCKENPDASVCVKGSFGGSCGAFHCKGDGIQCALALQVHKSACDWKEVDEALVTEGQAAMNGQPQPTGHPFLNAEQSSMAFSTVISQNNLIAGSCPADVSVSVGGQSYVIPWSQHCGKFQLIGTLMTGLSMLVAAFIVFRN